MGRRERRNEKRRQQIGQIVIGIFMVGVMLLSILGYAHNQGQGGTNEYQYNDFAFAVSAEGFRTEIDGQVELFQTIPILQNESLYVLQDPYRGIARVTLDPAVFGLLENAVYIGVTFDPATPHPLIQAAEVARFDLGQTYQNSYQGVINATPEYPLPLITCADAEPDVPIIEITLTNETNGEAMVVINDNCISIIGDALGVYAAKDTIRYKRFGVLE